MLKEVVLVRLACHAEGCSILQVAFVGFILQAQSTGKGPLASAAAHISDPFHNNILTNIGQCHIPKSVNVEGLTIPLTCLWPGQQVG